MVVVSNNLYVLNDFTMSNNSRLSTSAELFYYGNFTVNAGSSYESVGNYTCFWGADNRSSYKSYGQYTTKDQTITMAGNVSFAGISCRCSSLEEGTKTLVGSIVTTGELRAWGLARIVDDADSYSHEFGGVVAEGEIDLSSHMTITNGTIRRQDAVPRTKSNTFSIDRKSVV